MLRIGVSGLYNGASMHILIMQTPLPNRSTTGASHVLLIQVSLQTTAHDNKEPEYILPIGPKVVPFWDFLIEF